MDKKRKLAAFLLWMGGHATLGPPAALSLTLAGPNEQLHCALLQAKSDCFLTQATPAGVQ
ncbi:hypothetical protein [Hymenobacter arizonensis]|uniref:Uncharacterized protein n=1 Tax=Hymenobacter arizonensis TaxID=1227077 RepID=A0A1I5Y309_HYMAR|nr:hypothetical protein [Hymenobacter arizonensis]SFQ38500.1 hypothetical protein SAMN04515668_2187 [Hymenobacter arizonensis]